MQHVRNVLYKHMFGYPYVSFAMSRRIDAPQENKYPAAPANDYKELADKDIYEDDEKLIDNVESSRIPTGEDFALAQLVAAGCCISQQNVRSSLARAQKRLWKRLKGHNN